MEAKEKEKEMEKVAQPQVRYKPTAVLAWPVPLPKSLVPKPVPPRTNMITGNYDIPVSLICNSCGTLINKGTNLPYRRRYMFNKWRPEITKDKYYLNCTTCSSEMLIEQTIFGKWSSEHFTPSIELEAADLPVRTVTRCKDVPYGMSDPEDEIDEPEDEIEKPEDKMERPRYMTYFKPLKNFEDYPKQMEYLKKPFVLPELHGNSKNKVPHDRSQSLSSVYRVSSSATRQPEVYLKKLFSVPPTHANRDHEGTETPGSSRLGVKMSFQSGCTSVRGVDSDSCKRMRPESSLPRNTNTT